MTSSKQMQAELQRLHEAAEAARLKERGEVLDRIRALIIEHELTPGDFGFKDEPLKKKAGVVPPKYRDPVTGATWSGRGRTPLWMAGKDRLRFKI